jgi:hypothetical protein
MKLYSLIFFDLKKKKLKLYFEKKKFVFTIFFSIISIGTQNIQSSGSGQISRPRRNLCI